MQVWKIYQTTGPIGTKFGTRLENLPNGWNDWHTSADSSGNGHMLKTISPSIPKGELWGSRGSKMQKSGKSTKRLDRLAQNLVHVWKIYQTAGTIGTHLQIHLGMDIC